MNETDIALICKALGDSNRLKIVQMLADGEMCACKLLERFHITQWNYYTLNCETLAAFKGFIDKLECCRTQPKGGCCCACEE